MTEKQKKSKFTPLLHVCIARWPKIFLKANNINYIEYPVAVDVAKRQEMINKSGQMGVPVIVIDGKELAIGFDKALLSQLLGIK